MRLGQVHRMKLTPQSQRIVIGHFGTFVTLYDGIHKTETVDTAKHPEVLEVFELCPWEEVKPWAKDFLQLHAPDVMPKLEPCSRWKHNESDATYVVIGTTNTTSDLARRGEFPQSVTYENEETGESWSRSIFDFLSRVNPL